MKKFALSLLLLSSYLISIAANADVLCVRKREKTKANGSGFPKNFQVLAGSTCPRGFTPLVDTSVFQGPAGATGATGDTTGLDYYQGGTGPTNLPTLFTAHPAGAVGVPGQSQNYYFTSSLNSCAEFEYRFDVTTAPGAGNAWRFYLESRPNSGTPSNQLIACAISNTDKSCSGSGALVHNVGNSLNVVSVAFAGTPAATRAGWAVRCISE